MAHIPVLLQPSLDGLALQSGDVFIDATLGGGGHSEAIARQFGDSIAIYGIDLDQTTLTKAADRVSRLTTKFIAIPGNFRDLATLLPADVRPTKMLFDLGTSSIQLDDSGRGFTFRKKEPLVMTLNSVVGKDTVTAHDIVNDWEEANLATIIRGFGEERYAGRIAHAIAETRKIRSIETTFDLVEIIESAVPAAYKRGKIHPATRTFQAIRIAANDELGALEQGIKDGFEKLASGGRMAVISFHSLEDRIVKHYFNSLIAEGRAERITKKPITPSDEEKKENPRSRSAKLRIILKK